MPAQFFPDVIPNAVGAEGSYEANGPAVMCKGLSPTHAPTFCVAKRHSWRTMTLDPSSLRPFGMTSWLE